MKTIEIWEITPTYNDPIKHDKHRHFDWDEPSSDEYEGKKLTALVNDGYHIAESKMGEKLIFADNPRPNQVGATLTDAYYLKYIKVA